jgi:hypothetical protein
MLSACVLQLSRTVSCSVVLSINCRCKHLFWKRLIIACVLSGLSVFRHIGITLTKRNANVLENAVCVTERQIVEWICVVYFLCLYLNKHLLANYTIYSSFLWRRAPQQMLRKHRSRKAYYAIL